MSGVCGSVSHVSRGNIGISSRYRAITLDQARITHLYAAPVNQELTRAVTPEKLVDREEFNHMPEGRVADPFIIEADGKLYLFAAAGGTPTSRIVCAEEMADDLL